MFPHEESLVPIYLWRRDKEYPEQVGTGIYLQLLDQPYLLTAGHVADLRSEGSLCIPSTEGISPLEGGIGGNVLAPNANRKNDKFDVAYIRLSTMVASLMHPTFVPIPRSNVDIDGGVLPGDFCSVGGYPVTKASRTEVAYQSETYAYVGVAVEHEEYFRLGYDPAIHLIVSYNIKKGIFPEGDRINPPHPRGLSGGGIFRLQPESLHAPRTLIGSMHTYKEREKCFIGTRIPGHLLLIEKRFPHEYRSFAEAY
jgi:hypothetical protein